MSKHTPGPWSVEIGDETADYAHQFPIIVADDFEVVGTEGFYSGDLQIDIANANLAAAAPELLDALEDLVAEGVRRHGISRYRKAKLAIRKAKGEL